MLLFSLNLSFSFSLLFFFFPRGPYFQKPFASCPLLFCLIGPLQNEVYHILNKVMDVVMWNICLLRFGHFLLLFVSKKVQENRIFSLWHLHSFVASLNKELKLLLKHTLSSEVFRLLYYVQWLTYTASRFFCFFVWITLTCQFSDSDNNFCSLLM